MTLSCVEVRDRFEAYGAEALAAPERRAVRDHLGSCEPCRAEAAGSDPLFVFAGARGGAATVLPEETAGVLAAVRTGIALRTAERRLEKPAARRRAGALFSAAAALALTLLVPGAPARRAPADAVPADREAAKTDFLPAANPAPAGENLQKTGVTRKYPADATIYDFNPGAGEPRVVWIVDRSIDI